MFFINKYCTQQWRLTRLFTKYHDIAKSTKEQQNKIFRYNIYIVTLLQDSETNEYVLILAEIPGMCCSIKPNQHYWPNQKQDVL